jgi:hypothetical protein
MKRIEAVAAFRVKDDEVFLASAFLGVANPIAGFLSLSRENQAAHGGYS